MKLSAFRQRPGLAALVGLAVLLEAAFLVLRRLHPWDENVVGVIAVGLAARAVYFLAARLALTGGGRRGVGRRAFSPRGCSGRRTGKAASSSAASPTSAARPGR